MKRLQKFLIRTRFFNFWREPMILILGIIIIYCLIGLAAYWPIFPGDSSRLTGCTCGDPVQSVWFLRWTPYAIVHGHNPFFTNWINVPYGANLAQNTLMPLLGLLTAPLSVFISPVASFNLLAWLAFPLSAGAMFYVVKQLTRSSFAAFIAGLLYGLSPYVVGQAAGHIMLSFIPLPPLILYTVWKLFITQHESPAWLGILLAAEVIAQFLIEPEVLAITAMVTGMALILTAGVYYSSITKERLLYAGKGLIITTLLAILCLAYPIWFMVSGPQHFTGPNFAADNPYRSDFFSLVLPTLNERVVPSMFKQIASKTAGGDYPESGAYLGLPLLLLICFAVVRWRHNRWLILSTILAFICWLLSLGPRLVVYGTTTSIRLPFTVLVHIPFLQNIIPGRLSLGEWLFIPIIVAVAIVEWQRESKLKLKAASLSHHRFVKGCLILLAASILVTLLPRWPYPSQPTNIPGVLASSRQVIPSDVTVLTYPFPLFPSDQAMLWQATSGMRYKLLGGYIQNLGPTGNENLFPALLSPPTVQEWLAHEQATNTLWPTTAYVTDSDIRLYLRVNNVGAIAVEKTTLNAVEVAQSFENVLGRPDISSNALIWTHVQAKVTAIH